MIEIRNLTIRAGSAPIVNNLSLTIGLQETLALVGESGCGKSTVALALMGLLSNKMEVEGEILLDGQNLLQMRERQWQKVRGKQIGMIFQDAQTALNPTMRIGAQVTEAIRQHQPVSRVEAKHQALDMLYRVGIWHPRQRFAQYPHELSGGLRQRAIIALALACRPRLLIADEPTTALDVTVQAQILDLLRQLQEQFGMSILLISHDLGVVAGMCRRMGVMYAGHIVEEGDVDDLFEHPQHPYTQGLLRCLPTGETLQPIPGHPPRPGEVGEGCPFAPRCPHAMNICTQQTPVHDGRTACWLRDSRCSHA